MPDLGVRTKNQTRDSCVLSLSAKYVYVTTEQRRPRVGFYVCRGSMNSP